MHACLGPCHRFGLTEGPRARASLPLRPPLRVARARNSYPHVSPLTREEMASLRVVRERIPWVVTHTRRTPPPQLARLLAQTSIHFNIHPQHQLRMPRLVNFLPRCLGTIRSRPPWRCPLALPGRTRGLPLSPRRVRTRPRILRTTLYQRTSQSMKAIPPGPCRRTRRASTAMVQVGHAPSRGCGPCPLQGRWV